MPLIIRVAMITIMKCHYDRDDDDACNRNDDDDVYDYDNDVRKRIS